MGAEIHIHARNVKLEEENKLLRYGLKAVRDLIDSSEGVTGLHMNGDTAAWGDLLKGGRFEEWLIEFSDAEDI